MRSILTKWFLPSSFEMRTSSTSQLAGGREDASLSVSLCAGTNRMCPTGIWSVSRLIWLRIVAEYQGVSSQMGSTITTKKGVVVSVDEARACRIAFLMSPGSYSRFAVHELVRR